MGPVDPNPGLESVIAKCTCSSNPFTTSELPTLHATWSIQSGLALP